MTTDAPTDMFHGYTLPDESTYRYTHIDELDRDPIPAGYDGPLYFVAQFLHPENVMNCNIRAMKIKGVYRTEAEMNAACELIKQNDASSLYFPLCGGELFAWLPIDPDVSALSVVEDQEELNKIMGHIGPAQLRAVNEMAGRTKENIKKSRKNHEKRVHDNILSAAAATHVTQTSASKKKNKEASTDAKQHVRRSNHDKQSARASLMRRLEEREKKKASQSNQVQPDADTSTQTNVQDTLAQMKSMYARFKTDA